VVGVLVLVTVLRVIVEDFTAKDEFGCARHDVVERERGNESGGGEN